MTARSFNPTGHRLLTAVVGLGLLVVAGCSARCGSAAETPPPPLPPAVPHMPDAVKALPPEEARFTAASIELACVGATHTAPAEIARQTQEIYRRYGFDAPMDYLRLLREHERNQAIAALVEEGSAGCRR